MNWEHYNRSLNKWIHSKNHYKEEMKRQGMVPQEQGDDIARQAREKNRKDYKPSGEVMKFLYSAKGSVKDGKIKFSGRQLAFMEKIGVNFKKPKDRPLEGGWE